MLPKRVLYYGKDEPLPEQVHLRAGPLSAVYEGGDLRYVKFGGREILRRVYVAIRDRDWGTVTPKLSNVQMEVGADSFRIRYDVENKEGEVDFFWQGSITGDAQGTITFTMDGVARSTFIRNRIGFCILHPARECAGQVCTVETVDGAIHEGAFPLYISPHQPFVDMRAISHEVAPGLWAEVRFAGDTFEMEDQRNWTDASYKTYCTPLVIPHPVEIKHGTRVAQSVTLTLKGQAPTAPLQKQGTTAAGPAQSGLSFSVGQAVTGQLPRLGLGMASHGQPLSQKELGHLKALHLSHLRADLWLGRPGWEAVLERAAAESGTLGVPLEVAVILTDAGADELRGLIGALNRAGPLAGTGDYRPLAGTGDYRRPRPRVCTWLVFHEKEGSTTEKWLTQARAHLYSYDPAARIAGGTNHFFAELNRGRPATAKLDLVTYSVNPEVHAFDNASMVENLEAQAGSVESARQFSDGRPIMISPVTFRMRLNPNATGPEPEPAPGRMPWRVDVRQMSLFGAGWTVGSLKYLAESGVYSATYFETSGWLGVMETEAGSPLPHAFRSLPGAVFPMYHVFADVGEFAGGQVISARSGDALQLDGLALHKDGKTRLLLANLTDKAQTVAVQGLNQCVHVRQLDETNAEEAMRAPEQFRAAPGETMPPNSTGTSQPDGGVLQITMRPYAVARVDQM